MDNHENVVSVTSTCKERQSQSIDFILENILEMIIKAK